MKKLAVVLFVIAALILVGCFGDTAEEYYPENIEDVYENGEEDIAEDEDYFIARIYHADDMAINLEYIEVAISYENMVEETITKMLEINGIPIDDFWYEETHLVVSLVSTDRESPYDIWQHLQGSTGALITTRIIGRTFASFPSAETMEILLNGERTLGEHIDFDSVFELQNMLIRMY